MPEHFFLGKPTEKKTQPAFFSLVFKKKMDDCELLDDLQEVWSSGFMSTIGFVQAEFPFYQLLFKKRKWCF